MFCSKRLMEKRQTFLTKYFGLTNVLKKKPHHIFELHIFFGRTDISPGTGVPPICMNYSHTHGSNYFQTCPYCRLGICRENLLILPRVDKVFRKPWRWRGLCKNSHCQIHSNTPDALGIEEKKSFEYRKVFKMNNQISYCSTVQQKRSFEQRVVPSRHIGHSNNNVLHWPSFSPLSLDYNILCYAIRMVHHPPIVSCRLTILFTLYILHNGERNKLKFNPRRKFTFPDGFARGNFFPGKINLYISLTVLQ